jgi:hypothetical protein
MRADLYRIRLGRGRAYRDPGIGREYHRPAVAATVHDSGRVSFRFSSAHRGALVVRGARDAPLEAWQQGDVLRTAIEAGLAADAEPKHSPRLETWKPGLRVRKDPMRNGPRITTSSASDHPGSSTMLADAIGPACASRHMRWPDRPTARDRIQAIAQAS